MAAKIGTVRQSGQEPTNIRMRYADYKAAMVAEPAFDDAIELGSLGRPYASYDGVPIVFDNACWPGEVRVDIEPKVLGIWK